MPVRRFGDLTDFNFAPDHAPRLFLYKPEDLGERITAAGCDYVMSTVTYGLLRKGETERVADVVDMGEIANRRSIAVQGQRLSVHRSV